MSYLDNLVNYQNAYSTKAAMRAVSPPPTFQTSVYCQENSTWYLWVPGDTTAVSDPSVLAPSTAIDANKGRYKSQSLAATGLSNATLSGATTLSSGAYLGITSTGLPSVGTIRSPHNTPIIVGRNQSNTQDVSLLYWGVVPDTLFIGAFAYANTTIASATVTKFQISLSVPFSIYIDHTAISTISSSVITPSASDSFADYAYWIGGTLQSCRAFNSSTNSNESKWPRKVEAVVEKSFTSAQAFTVPIVALSTNSTFACGLLRVTNANMATTTPVRMDEWKFVATRSATGTLAVNYNNVASDTFPTGGSYASASFSVSGDTINFNYTSTSDYTGKVVFDLSYATSF